jgi:hypothetical protein
MTKKKAKQKSKESQENEGTKVKVKSKKTLPDGSTEVNLLSAMSPPAPPLQHHSPSQPPRQLAPITIMTPASTSTPTTNK